MRAGRVAGRARGDLSSMTWLDLPNVTAPSGDDRSQTVKLRISDNFVARNAFISRRTPIFQLWTHVVGELPPINNIGRVASGKPAPSIMTLHDSVACFEGLKRPHDAEPDGASVRIYVLRPEVSVEYFADMACVARAIIVPKNSVLTVQVCPIDPLHKDSRDINGTVTRLEFVFSEGELSNLPADSKNRYARRLW